MRTICINDDAVSEYVGDCAEAIEYYRPWGRYERKVKTIHVKVKFDYGVMAGIPIWFNMKEVTALNA